MPEISLMICIALIFLAYTHAYDNRDWIPLCALFAASTSTVYFLWLHIRDEVMGKVAAVNDVYRRAWNKGAAVYDIIAEGAFAFGQDFERVYRAVYCTPRWVRWGCWIFGVAVELGLLMVRAWYLEEEEQLTKLLAWSCANMLLLVVCPKPWDKEVEGKQKETQEAEQEPAQEQDSAQEQDGPVASGALVLYTSPAEEPESPREQQRFEREIKQKKMLDAYRKQLQEDQEREQWGNAHKDGASATHHYAL